MNVPKIGYCLNQLNYDQSNVESTLNSSSPSFGITLNSHQCKLLHYLKGVAPNSYERCGKHILENSPRNSADSFVRDFYEYKAIEESKLLKIWPFKSVATKIDATQAKILKIWPFNLLSDQFNKGEVKILKLISGIIKSSKKEVDHKKTRIFRAKDSNKSSVVFATIVAKR